MAVKTKAVLQNVQSKLQAGGRCTGGVGIGEPTKPPESPYAAVFMGGYEHATTTLTGTVERRTIIIRLYVKHFGDPASDAEFLMDDIVTETMEDFLEEFDLGGNVRNVEPLGVTGTPGYQMIVDTWYRVCDIRVPVLIDDSATFAP